MELKILKQEETPENVIEHSKAVYKKAMVIAANLKMLIKILLKKEHCYMILAGPKPMA